MKCCLQCVNTLQGHANLPGQALVPAAAHRSHRLGWLWPHATCCLICGQQTLGSQYQLGTHWPSVCPVVACMPCPAFLGCRTSMAARPERGPWAHTGFPGLQLCPGAPYMGLIRNTCVHGISCPSSAFISSASKNLRHAKVKETSQSITQTTATRAADRTC